MRTFSRRGAPPEQGWFQIGEVPQQTPPRHRGHGRVSLSATQHNPDTARPEPPAPKPTPMLVRANGAAAKALERIVERRYGALALCVTALLLVLIVVVTIVSQRSGSATVAETSRPISDRGASSVLARQQALAHREQAQIAGLESELRASRQQLSYARFALTHAGGRPQNATTSGPGNQNPQQALLGGSQVSPGTPTSTSEWKSQSTGSVWFVTLPTSFAVQVVN